jgi:two-component system sensor histidine kinase DesK
MTGSLWTPRHPFRFMVLATVMTTLISPFFTIVGTPGEPGRSALAPALLGAGLVTIQLWHSIAAARGERPRSWPWTLLALAALVYVPIPRYSYNWLATQAVLSASILMLLRPRWLAVTVAALSALGTIGYFPLGYFFHFWRLRSSWHAAAVAFEMIWWIGIPLIAAVIYGGARLVLAAEELRAAHTDLAELTIAQERLRISRDLHDLIGQSLSAVALRGDLALLLLDTDPRAAEAEILTLTGTARDALHDVLTVTRNPGGADLGTETEGARALLAAAGIAATVDGVPDGLSPEVRVVFAWALREGVTNVLRHSEASECSISTMQAPGGPPRMEIVNDGVHAGPAAAFGGSGLTGLAERARAFAGEVTAGPLPGGRFRLLVDFPGEVR